MADERVSSCLPSFEVFGVGSPARKRGTNYVAGDGYSTLVLCFSPFSTDRSRENVLIAAAATSSVINAFDTKDAGLS